MSVRLPNKSVQLVDVCWLPGYQSRVHAGPLSKSPPPFRLEDHLLALERLFGFASIRMVLGPVVTIISAMSALEEDRDKVDPYSIYSCSGLC